MSDVLDRSEALAREIEGLTTIRALARAQRRQRRLNLLLAASIAFDVGLSIMLGSVAWQARDLAQQASSIQARAYATCLSGNEARAGQMQLWHYVLDLPPTTPRTPAQQQQADQFGRYIDQLFAPRKC